MAKRKTPKKTPATKPIKKPTGKTVATLRHEEASRKNIPTAEYQSMIEREQQSPVRVAYERRNRDPDPQLVWRGKDEQDWSDLVVHAPPLYIQEKVHPKALVDDLSRRSQARQKAAEPQLDLFADFNGLPDADARTEFYRHDANWNNRMILGDSLAVGEDDELIDPQRAAGSPAGDPADFAQMILDILRTAGVQQAHKEDKIDFVTLAPWPGRLICAEGRFVVQASRLPDAEGPIVVQASRLPDTTGDATTDMQERRAGVFIGPEFGTVSRQDLVEAAREAADANFDVLVACALNYEAHASEFNKLGRIHVLKARMNADLHMAGDLKNTGKVMKVFRVQ